MSDAQEIRVMRAAALFAILVFFAVPAKGVFEPHKKGSFTEVFEEYSPLSDTKSISSRMMIYLEQASPYKKHNYDLEYVYKPFS